MLKILSHFRSGNSIGPFPIPFPRHPPGSTPPSPPPPPSILTIQHSTVQQYHLPYQLFRFWSGQSLIIRSCMSYPRPAFLGHHSQNVFCQLLASVRPWRSRLSEVSNSLINVIIKRRCDEFRHPKFRAGFSDGTICP